MADAPRACSRRVRLRRHASVLWAGGFLSTLGLGGVIHIVEVCLRTDFSVASQMDLALPGAALAAGLLLLWHGRLSLRLGRQLAGVVVAAGGALGTRLLVVLIDQSAGSLGYLLDHVGVPSLLMLASPAALGVGLLLVFAGARRSAPRRWYRGAACGRPVGAQRRVSASARPKSPL